MRKERTSRRRRTLIRIGLLSIPIAILVAAATYLYLNNALTDALFQSLGTFQIASVTYPTVEPDRVDLNITFRIENPTEYSITIERIRISFAIDNKDIGGINVSPNQTLGAGENTAIYFIHSVREDRVLNSVRSQTYILTVTGRIRGSARYSFLQTYVGRPLDSSSIEDGIPQAKS